MNHQIILIKTIIIITNTSKIWQLILSTQQVNPEISTQTICIIVLKIMLLTWFKHCYIMHVTVLPICIVSVFVCVQQFFSHHIWQSYVQIYLPTNTNNNKKTIINNASNWMSNYYCILYLWWYYTPNGPDKWPMHTSPAYCLRSSSTTNHHWWFYLILAKMNETRPHWKTCT